jgi:membrane protein required for beta-lactamase induction
VLCECGKDRWQMGKSVSEQKKKKMRSSMQNLFDLVVLLLFFVLLLKLLLQWGSFQFFMTYLLFIVSFGFEREEFFFF